MDVALSPVSVSSFLATWMARVNAQEQINQEFFGSVNEQCWPADQTA